MRLKLSPNNWQRIRSNTKKRVRSPGGTIVQPIAPIAFRVPTPILIAQISSKTAKSNWWLAGYAQAYLYSGGFVSTQTIGFKQWKLGLSRPALLDFNEYEAPSQYAIEFTFPLWLQDIKLEVWRYKGSIEDAYHRDIQEIKTQLASIQQSVDDIYSFGK